jgi:pilus assembly protein CpaB
MKQRRLLIVLLLALVCGVGAAYLSITYLGQSATPLTTTPAGATNQLAVAARDMPLGAVLRAEDVRMIPWSGGALPAGYANAAATVVGRGLITPVAMNEPLLATKLADKEAGGGLSIVIPEGMRAVSVKVDEVIAVAGFVTPGTRVDVLVTMSPGIQQQTNVTRVILQNIQVLAAGQTVQRDLEGKPQTVTVITLLVTPEQAERLTLASNEGRIQLALRNTLDVTETTTSGMQAATLVGDVRAGAPAPRAVSVGASTGVRPRARSAPRETGTVVETFRGGQRTLSTFSSGGS